jgi:hypothetical protein
MAAEGKAPRTIRNYTEAVRWFAAAHVLSATGKRRWEEVDKADIRRWAARLLGEYSTAQAGNQFRAVRRFLRWLAIEDDRPDPVGGLGCSLLRWRGAGEPGWRIRLAGAPLPDLAWAVVIRPGRRRCRLGCWESRVRLKARSGRPAGRLRTGRRARRQVVAGRPG